MKSGNWNSIVSGLSQLIAELQCRSILPNISNQTTLQLGTAVANAMIPGAASALVNVLILCSRRPVGRGNRLMCQINGLAQSV